jgi:hypothetical protein
MTTRRQTARQAARLPNGVGAAIDELLVNTDLEQIEPALARAVSGLAAELEAASDPEHRLFVGRLTAAEVRRVKAIARGWDTLRRAMGDDSADALDLIGHNVAFLPDAAAVEIGFWPGVEDTAPGAWLRAWLKVGDGIAMEAGFRASPSYTTTPTRGQTYARETVPPVRRFVDRVVDVLLESGEGVTVYQASRTGASDRTVQVLAILLHAAGAKVPKDLKKILIASKRGAPGRARARQAARKRPNPFAEFIGKAST